MSVDQLQFYPTPRSLASKMWSKFEEAHHRLVLDPSAGNGDLLDVKAKNIRAERVHCIEIDPTRQATLRGKGYQVIDSDFLKHEGGFFYSHILLNPPFNRGAAHVLHAANLIYNGELVALLNASSIRNPRGDAEHELASLIERYNGSVEYLSGAFQTSETERVTGVEVAILHLKIKNEFDNPYIQSLAGDNEPTYTAPDHFELAVPQSRIDSLLLSFKAAVRALREYTLAEDAYAYHRSFLASDELPHREGYRSPQEIRDSIAHNYNAAYAELRSSAWDKVMRSTEFERHLSHKAMQRLQSDFDNIRVLAFTADNIYNFLGELIRDRARFQLEMMCDSFDMVTRHTKNKAVYRSWKSNDKHRECAYRIRTTRIILPVNCSIWNQPDFSRIDEIRDFERVFALLDGKHDIPEDMVTVSGLLNALKRNKQSQHSIVEELRTGGRVKTEYFDLRYYRGAGTCHLFPVRADLVDRLNREVGKFRNWLPDTEPDNSAYWKQYNAAEKATDKLLKHMREVERKSATSDSNMLWQLQQDPVQFNKCISVVHAGMGLDVDTALPHENKDALTLS